MFGCQVKKRGVATVTQLTEGDSASFNNIFTVSFLNCGTALTQLISKTKFEVSQPSGSKIMRGTVTDDPCIYSWIYKLSL